MASENNFHLPNSQKTNLKNQKELAVSYDITQQTMNNYMKRNSLKVPMSQIRHNEDVTTSVRPNSAPRRHIANFVKQKVIIR